MARYVSWLANAVLFTLCCALLAGIVNTVFAALLTPSAAELASAPPTVEIADRSWSQREEILRRNLFNSSVLTPQLGAGGVAGVGEDVEETKLPLALCGTMASDDPANSWACVQHLSRGETLVLQRHQDVEPQVTVASIERRRILLSERGALRELALEEDAETPAAAAPKAAPRSPRRPPARERSSARRTRPSGAAGRALDDPAALFSQVQMAPKYTEEGQMSGIQVSRIKPGSLYEKLGIRDGDVITEFNGIQVRSPADSAQILSEMRSAQELNATVERDGEIEQLSYLREDAED